MRRIIGVEHHNHGTELQAKELHVPLNEVLEAIQEELLDLVRV